MQSAKQGGTKYYFWVFGMTRPGIESRYPGPLANITQTDIFINISLWIYCFNIYIDTNIYKFINPLAQKDLKRYFKMAE